MLLGIYLDSEVRMQQHLDVERLIVVIGHYEARRETLPVQRDAVDKAKGVRPQRLGRIVQRRRTKPEVELDGQVRGRR